MKKAFLKVCLAVPFFAGLTSCTGDDNPVNGTRVAYMLPETQSLELTAEQKNMVQKNNDFAFNLFRIIDEKMVTKKSNGLSPASVAYLMGMLNAGADGLSSKEMTSVLGFGESDVKTVNEFCKTMIEGLPKVDTSVKLGIYNYIAANSSMGITLKSQFEKDVKDYYHADYASLDFTKPEALKTINDWCSKKTDGKIDKILDQLDGTSLLVLLNAVNFKAGWVDKFDEKDTKTEDFTLVDNTKKELPMMHNTAHILYNSNDTYSSLLLPYGGKDPKWHMMVLLPKDDKTVEDVLTSLTAAKWKENREGMMARKVDIKIPRFTTDSENDLIPPITTLGAPSIFDPDKADFTKMSNYPNLYVAKMLQKSSVEVNEKGTELVATTVADMNATSAGPDSFEPINFHCDRPFVYVIYEASSGTVFFIGTYRGE